MLCVSAEDRVDAAVIAEQCKHVRDMINSVVTGPLPMKDPDMKSQFEINRRGQLGWESGQWFFIKEV